MGRGSGMEGAAGTSVIRDAAAVSRLAVDGTGEFHAALLLSLSARPCGHGG